MAKKSMPKGFPPAKNSNEKDIADGIKGQKPSFPPKKSGKGK